MIQLKRPLNILLVEDNILNQKLMYFNLTKMGFSINIVNDGQQAIDAYKQQFYDIILMDIMMPILDGYQTTKIIRDIEIQTGHKSYIIGLTSNVYDSDKDKCLSIGMDDFIPKPFDIDVFCKILKDQQFL